MNPTTPPAGLILAGGRGLRWGGQDKGLIVWREQPMASHVASHLRPWCAPLVVSCNRNQTAYAGIADFTVSDAEDTFEGPLAGLLAALDDPRLAAAELLLTSPCDTPLLGAEYPRRMLNHPSAGGRILVAGSGTHRHFLHMLLPCRYRDSLATYFAAGGRSVKNWLATTEHEFVHFDDQPECFANFNSSIDLPLSGHPSDGGNPITGNRAEE